MPPRWSVIRLAGGLLLAIACGLMTEARAQEPASVTVDVEALDPDGRPIPGLTSEAFQVTVGGQARRVVSAEFVGTPASGQPDRAIVLAIDTASFTEEASLAAAIAAQGLVDRLPRADPIRIVSYPAGPRAEMTTDRNAIRRVLETLAIDAPPAADADPFQRTLSALDDLLPSLAGGTARTVVVIVTAAPAANGPARTRPATDALIPVSQQAARSNAAIYTLLVGRGFLDMTVPHKPAPPGADPPPPARDDEVVEQWLAELSGRSGGALVKIAGPNPVPAIARLLLESSAHYRLGLAGEQDDGGGRLRPLRVQAQPAGSIVRAPGWLVLPASAASPVEPSAPAEATRSAPDAILDAYDRGEYDVATDRLVRLADLPRWLRMYRTMRPRWPERPRRGAVLALEAAAAALATDRRPAIDEAVSLLVQQAAVVRAPGTADEFECEWYWTGLMLFEAGHPDAGEPFARQAIDRCGHVARIVLAGAVLADQRTPVLSPAIRIGAAAAAEAAAHQRVVEQYEIARQFPETAFEARIREAWLLFRMKKLDEALALTDDLDDIDAHGDDLPSASPQMQYISNFVRAQALRERRRFDEAAAAYRRALAAWPEGQSARVSLMTLMAVTGQRDQAERLAQEIEAAPRTARDPWWIFWEGDRPLYPVVVQKLREARP